MHYSVFGFATNYVFGERHTYVQIEELCQVFTTVYPY